MLTSGIDPSQQKRRGKASKRMAGASTIEALASESVEKKHRQGKVRVTSEKVEWLLGLVNPNLGSMPIMEITAADILAAIRPIEADGKYETAIRLPKRIALQLLA